MNSVINRYTGLFVLVLSILACDLPSPGPSPTSTPSSTPTPAPTPTPTRLRPQAGPDSDGDWVSDLDETQFGSSNSIWDTDGDGTTDFLEIFVIGSDPVVSEGNSDGDCCRDVTEQKLLGTDPKVFDEDRDGDSIPDSVELRMGMGSDPGKADTDGDMLSDFIEIFLTETDPTVADPIADSGFPKPLLAWMPASLQNSPCRFQVGATIDQLYVPDPEEADGPNDLFAGDEVIMYYGLWADVPAVDRDNPLAYVWNMNPAHSRLVQGTVFKDDRFTDFTHVPPVTASCGQVVTFAIQVFESDAPWGGDRDFGTWLEHIPLLINNVPPAWDYSYSSEMYYEGTGGDSETYRYEIDYSITAEATE